MTRSEKNPFEYGRELALSELVDRQDELREIETAIRNRGKLFLIGPRRFGKTSLLSAADEAASRRGVIVLRHDAEKYENLELLAAAILTSAARALQGPLEKTIEVIRSVASRLQPRITFEDGIVSVGIGVGREEKQQLPLLANALDAVEALAGKTGREAVIILDEVQQVVVEHGISAERMLRSTVQQHRNIGYIFAGSDTRLLTAMTSELNRPFYRLGNRIFLGIIPRPEFVRFIENAFRQSDVAIAEDACIHILNLAEDVPYNVQRLAYETWEIARESDAAEISMERINAALERIVRREDPAYTQIWNSLTVNRKKALKAIMEGSDKSLLSAAVTNHYEISTSSLQVAMKDLEAAHLIRANPNKDGAKYSLVDPFFSTWLRISQEL